MQNILILGANGGLAQSVIPVLLNETDAKLTLFLRNATRLKHLAGSRVDIVEGDVMDLSALTAAMQDKTMVYANLSGNLKAMAENTVRAMDAAGVKRLVWISSMGIYGETGENHGAILEPYRQSAAVVEASDLDYTVIRPAWFTNAKEVSYRLTMKGEPFQGSQVSKRSIADFIAKLVHEPELYVRESVGIAKV
ncbi:NAD(P)H-binding protein [Eikenella sp. S3360]|uniref:NAD(P)H-binding protein n=1 Tax=Eikenella glucosivorans TaxID=2766967 RepID=A0ABS0NA49_9NEIS|nr:NAD(P)H-binding protein [Eikenella glucosivorans]MBH5329198.1 NAD(P)H-binding protein [Eikenella glucosivorans]